MPNRDHNLVLHRRNEDVVKKPHPVSNMWETGTGFEFSIRHMAIYKHTSNRSPGHFAMLLYRSVALRHIRGVVVIKVMWLNLKVVLKEFKKWTEHLYSKTRPTVKYQ